MGLTFRPKDYPRMANLKVRKDIDLEDGVDGLKNGLESALRSEQSIARRQNGKVAHSVPDGICLS
jgi:hypothetical protein